MLRQVADGVLIRQSDFMESNTVVVQGGSGVLLVDPGIRADEIADLVSDLREGGHTVAAGFSTHPHWDHLLWHPGLGEEPRYGTARCAATIHARLADPQWKAAVVGMIPPDLADHVPLDDLFGRIVGLPVETARIPWDGPDVRIIEHQGHAPGHAALLIEERRVLIAGDMLSDVLIPILNMLAPDPVEDYLTALQLVEDAAADVEVVVPGHGSPGRGDQVQVRIDQDRAYVLALRDGRDPSDSRIGPSAQDGWEWVAGLHERQLQHLTQKSHH
jgi:glyoxylase-like metal-dependent hydrolase (beta-lactamase superfamily II)